MAERIIYIEPTGDRFKVVPKEAYRAKRNKSYANASECCGVTLKQEKVCSGCGEKVDAAECSRKIFKVGKQEYLIASETLEKAREFGDAEEIRFHTVAKGIPSEVFRRVDAVLNIGPAKKHEERYAEAVRSMEGFSFIGSAVFRGNEYEVVLASQDGALVMWRLVEPSQLNDAPDLSDVRNAGVDPEAIALLSQVFGKVAVSEYDFNRFRDARSETEERIIEQAVLGGAVPDAKPVVAVVEVKAKERLERLRALAGGA